MIRIQPDYLRKISGKLQQKEIIFLAMPSEKRATYENVRLKLGKSSKIRIDKIFQMVVRGLYLKILSETSSLCPEKTETKLFNSVIHKR